MKKLFLFFSIVLFISCDFKSPSGNNNSSNSDSVLTDNSSVGDATKIKADCWEYNEQTDQMTDKTIYFASVTANELLYFSAPYDGGSTLTLTLRKKPGGFDIYLHVSAGQFFSSNYDYKTIKVRFDKLTAGNYSYSEASDGSSEVIFIDNRMKFLKQLKKAKTLTVQCEFYDQGIHTSVFNVKGLKWNH